MVPFHRVGPDRDPSRVPLTLFSWWVIAPAKRGLALTGRGSFGFVTVTSLRAPGKVLAVAVIASTAALVAPPSSSIAAPTGVPSDALCSVVDDHLVVQGMDTGVVTQTGAGNVLGTPGDDRIAVTGPSMVSAGAGNDVVCAVGGGARDAQILNGDDGDDLLVGGDFSDYLLGGSGSDTLLGGLGNDYIWPGIGDADVADGGSDGGTVQYAKAAVGVIVQLSSPGSSTHGWSVARGDGPDKTDVLISINNASGSRHDDVITGDAGPNVIDGYYGDDLINGGDGDDTINGGYGEDTLRGQRGADSLDGYLGADVIGGGQGPDILRGSRGNDILRGGRGRDRLRGFTGVDRLDGGPHHDVCRGGRERDTAVRCEEQSSI